MVALKEIISFLEKMAPKELAQEYDNVGLLIGDKDAQIDSVLISLDTDFDVASEAISQGASLIISHHPLIFKPVKSITLQDTLGKTAYALIQNNISLYAMHTNVDAVNGGLCDYLLSLICNSKTIGTFTGGVDGIGRIAQLNSPITLGKLLDDIKTTLQIGHLKFVGNTESIIRKVGICNGGGGDFIYDAKKHGADIYISGDFKYHHARFAHENEIALIEISHYDAEIIFCNFMKQILEENFGDRLKVNLSASNKDVWQCWQE